MLNLSSVSVPSTRIILQHCVAAAIDQVIAEDFVSAGRILNLIHNLPLDEVKEQCWDIDYFLSIELPQFLEHFDGTKSSREIALYVCKQIGCRYLP
jgi:hypothetical protein